MSLIRNNFLLITDRDDSKDYPPPVIDAFYKLIKHAESLVEGTLLAYRGLENYNEPHSRLCLLVNGLISPFVRGACGIDATVILRYFSPALGKVEYS